MKTARMLFALALLQLFTPMTFAETESSSDCLDTAEIEFKQAFDLSAPYIEQDAERLFVRFADKPQGFYAPSDVISYGASSSRGRMDWNVYSTACFIHYTRSAGSIPAGTKLPILGRSFTNEGSILIHFEKNNYGWNSIECKVENYRRKRNRAPRELLTINPSSQSLVNFINSKKSYYQPVFRVVNPSCANSEQAEAADP